MWIWGIFMDEIWAVIKGYENYEVSSFGRVKSLERFAKMPMGGFVLIKERILKPGITPTGYLYVNLGGKNSRTIHRLVALNLIENTNNYKIVGHIDDIKTNNCISNLYWTTSSENNKRAYATGLKTGVFKGLKGKDNPFSKKIIQRSLDMEFIKEWDAQLDIQRETGFLQSGISACCRGNQKSAYGFIWKFK